MSDTTTYIQPKPAEKNGVTVATTDIQIKRGAKAGTVYPIAQVTIDPKDDAKTLANIIEHIKWRGVGVMAKALNGMEKQDGQAALEQAAEFTAKKVTDPETNKESEVFYITDVDPDEYWKYYLSDTMRGGVTKADLEAELATLTGECRKLIQAAMKESVGSPGQLAIMQQVSDMSPEIQSLEESIATRSRPPRQKKAAVAAAVTQPA